MKPVRIGEDVTVVVGLAASPCDGVEARTIADHAFVSHSYPETLAGGPQHTFRAVKVGAQSEIVCALYDENITWLRGWVDLNGPEAKALLAAHALRSAA